MRGRAQRCSAPGCIEAGEFRAPNPYLDPTSDAPPQWQWLCLDHVREFNARYNYFDGMSREEIELAQMPLSGWARETRAFSHGGVDAPPRWADFNDPLDAIATRFRNRTPRQRPDGHVLSGDERRALDTLKLDEAADRRALRRRYTELVRKYHPDHNGGDRSQERSLRAVVDAYGLLRKSAAFT